MSKSSMKCKEHPGCGCKGACKNMLEPLVVVAEKKTLVEVTLEVAASKVGVREVGGDNAGADVEMFQRAGKIRKGDPWCAAFINWCAEQAAKRLGVASPLEGVPLQGYVQSYVDYFKGKDAVHTAPKVGDLIVIWYPTLKRYGHIGIVTKVSGTTLTTVEGNTNAAGSREGNCVATKTRQVSPNTRFIRWT